MAPPGQVTEQPQRTVSVDEEGNISGLEEVLKQSGFAPEEEPAPEGTEQPAQEPEEAAADPKPAETQAPAPTPKVKLKWQGQEMEVDEPQAIALAQKGFDYQQKTQALAEKERNLAPYEGIVRQLQVDPQFAKHIVDYMQGNRPAPAQPAQPAEPTDPIEKLKAEIKQEFRKEFLPEIEQRITPQRQQLVINQVRQELMIDPMYRDVHSEVVKFVRNMPEAIGKTVWMQLDQDPDAYVKTYHAIREKMVQAKNANLEGATPPPPTPKPAEKRERAPILESAGNSAPPDEKITKRVKVDKLKAQALRSGDPNAIADWLLEGGFLDQIK